MAKQRKSGYICVANVHMLVEAYDNENVKIAVNNAQIITPDGVPLVFALKMLYNIKQDRVAGMDLFPELLKELEKNKLKVFLYGSTNEVLKKVNDRIKREFPNLNVVGSFSPPFRNLTPKEKQDIIKLINNSEANLVFVSLGCPKQELWMYEMYGKINSTMIGVGGAFPVYAGIVKRAPKWMQDVGLEWFYRFMQEPRRLFKRYAYTNSKFIYLFTKEYFKVKKENIKNA